MIDEVEINDTRRVRCRGKTGGCDGMGFIERGEIRGVEYYNFHGVMCRKYYCLSCVESKLNELTKSLKKLKRKLNR